MQIQNVVHCMDLRTEAKPFAGYAYAINGMLYATDSFVLVRVDLKHHFPETWQLLEGKQISGAFLKSVLKKSISLDFTEEGIVTKEKGVTIGTRNYDGNIWPTEQRFSSDKISDVPNFENVIPKKIYRSELFVQFDPELVNRINKFYDSDQLIFMFTQTTSTVNKMLGVKSAVIVRNALAYIVQAITVKFLQSTPLVNRYC